MVSSLSPMGWFLLIINLMGLLVMGWDKGQARLRCWRIPERILFTIAAMGGSAGVLLGMYTFRHKTKHGSFVIGIPLILLVQVTAALWILFYT